MPSPALLARGRCDSGPGPGTAGRTDGAELGRTRLLHTRHRLGGEGTDFLLQLSGSNFHCSSPKETEVRGEMD